LTDYPDLEKITEEKILNILSIANLAVDVITDQNPDESIFNFYLILAPTSGRSRVIIAQQKENEYQIEVVSAIRLAENHAKAFMAAPENVQGRLLHQFAVWLTPREPDYMLDGEFQGPEKQFNGFSIVLLVFSDELSVGTLVRSIRMVLKSARIGIRLVQEHLDKIITIPQENIEQ